MSQDPAYPRCSLITVTFNSEKTLADTIESVRRQTYPNIEYVIIDGASRDGTLSIVERHRDVVSVVVSEPDKGIYDAMNKGIARATGEVIGLVNSDDFLEPGAVEAVMQAYMAHPEADVLHGHVRLLRDEAGTSTIEYAPQAPEAVRFKQMPAWHPATYVTKRCYEALGAYDTSYRIASDYEFLLRVLADGRRFVRVDQVLSNMRVGGLSSTRWQDNFREKRAIKLRYGYPAWQAQRDYLTSLIKVATYNALSSHRGLLAWYQRRKRRAHMASGGKVVER